MTRHGIITDWGGVLTTPLKDAVAAWIEADGIDADGYREVMTEWVMQAYGGEDGHRTPIFNPVHGLEMGVLAPAEFEQLLAGRLRTLDGGPVVAEGLLQRMFLAFAPVRPMYDALRRAKAAGVRTCLLSNSWGNTYPRTLFTELFDGVVISSEVGLRKPDPEIFWHALDLLGLRPEACAFVDDFEHNVRAAEGLGLTGILHLDPDTTVARLETLVGVSLV